jgi:hypothetical protein
MNAEQIALALGGKRSGRQWACCCPAHEDRSPSLIVFDGREAVQVRCMAGCDPRDVIAVLKRRGLWDSNYARERCRLDNESRETPGYEMVDARKWAKHYENRPLAAPASDLAMKIWRETVSSYSTAGERYLRGRDLALPYDVADVRFHPHCPRAGGTQPALIALFRDDETDRPKAIHRLFLTKDATKDCAMMLGPVGGCAMKLTSRAETFASDLATCDCLNICEGLETGLALLASGIKPIWAVGSAGAIQSFPVIFGLGGICIWADNDAAGLYAAEQCYSRFVDAGRTAIIRTPEDEGYDFADFLHG